MVITSRLESVSFSVCVTAQHSHCIMLLAVERHSFISDEETTQPVYHALI